MQRDRLIGLERWVTAKEPFLFAAMQGLWKFHDSTMSEVLASVAWQWFYRSIRVLVYANSWPCQHCRFRYGFFISAAMCRGCFSCQSPTFVFFFLHDSFPPLLGIHIHPLIPPILLDHALQPS